MPGALHYDEADLMAVRVDGWRMHTGVKHHGDRFEERSYPSIPYVVNLLMDCLAQLLRELVELAGIEPATS